MAERPRETAEEAREITYKTIPSIEIRIPLSKKRKSLIKKVSLFYQRTRTSIILI